MTIINIGTSKKLYIYRNEYVLTFTFIVVPSLTVHVFIVWTGLSWKYNFSSGLFKFSIKAFFNYSLRFTKWNSTNWWTTLSALAPRVVSTNRFLQNLPVIPNNLLSKIFWKNFAVLNLRAILRPFFHSFWSNRLGFLNIFRYIKNNV